MERFERKVTTPLCPPRVEHLSARSHNHPILYRRTPLVTVCRVPKAKLSLVSSLAVPPLPTPPSSLSLAPSPHHHPSIGERRSYRLTPLSPPPPFPATGFPGKAEMAMGNQSAATVTATAWMEWDAPWPSEPMQFHQIPASMWWSSAAMLALGKMPRAPGPAPVHVWFHSYRPRYPRHPCHGVCPTVPMRCAHVHGRTSARRVNCFINHQARVATSLQAGESSLCGTPN